MAEQFVRVQYGSIFHNFRERVESLRDEILTSGSEVLRREYESSIRARWYDKGRTLRSLKEDIVVEGDRKTYQLFPTAVSKRGAPYPLFGEYGTGRRGAISGRPAPADYRYGQGQGMRARRFSRIAVAAAKPQVERAAIQKVKNFTVN